MLNRLVDDLSTLLAVGAQDLQYEPVDMAALVKNLALEFAVKAEEIGVQLSSEIKAPLPFIDGSPHPFVPGV